MCVRYLRLLVVSLLVLLPLFYSFSEDKKVWMYQSQLDELTTIISNLEKTNSERQIELEQKKSDLNETRGELAEKKFELLEKEMRLDEHEKSWNEYENKTKMELETLKFERDAWAVGTVVAGASAVLLFILNMLPR